MINPELTNWWSHKRLASLKYKDTSLNGAGVSMQVITKAFGEYEFTWFSVVYGRFNDNIILVAMSNDDANKFTKIKYDEQEIKRKFFGQILKNEYKITDEIASELGLTTSDTGFEIIDKDKFPFYIYSHDNCFFSIKPISTNLFARVIRVILQQHGYYQGEEVEWSGIESRLMEIIKSNKEIEIQSDPKKKYVWIPQIERNKYWFWKNFRKGTIIISESKALFRE
jgi:hypothetical protein